MRPFPRLLTFAAGAAAGIAFLAYCGGDPNANATTPDAGGSTTCDCPAAPDTAATKSGTRLKAKVLASADGARILTGWHDSERQEDCEPQKIGGEMRCYPSSSLWSGHFSDPQCTVRVKQGHGSADPKYIRDDEGKLFVAGETGEGDVYRLTSGTCSKSGSTAPWVKLGAEVSATSFVPLAEELR